jgi:hypothetical protein
MLVHTNKSQWSFPICGRWLRSDSVVRFVVDAINNLPGHRGACHYEALT